MQVRAKLLNGDHPHPPANEEKCPRGLWRMFSTCWSKDPSGRISISEALQVLEYL